MRIVVSEKPSRLSYDSISKARALIHDLFDSVESGNNNKNLLFAVDALLSAFAHVECFDNEKGAAERYDWATRNLRDYEKKKTRVNYLEHDEMPQGDC